jgi:hypothetical protein
MKKKQYISWLEERITFLENELYESRKREIASQLINQFNQQWQKS